VLQYLVTVLETREDEGQGMVEYGLIIVLVALVAAIGITTLGGNLNTFFANLAGKFPGA
jgi:pilus assembly protein Flp/PilA